MQDMRKLVDEYDNTRLARLAADKVSAELKEKETKLKALLMAALQDNNLTSVGGTLNSFSIKSSIVAHATAWPEIYEYVSQTQEFDLLYRRLNSAAVLLRLEQGVIIPGTTTLEVFDLSRAKVKG